MWRRVLDEAVTSTSLRHIDLLQAERGLLAHLAGIKDSLVFTLDKNDAASSPRERVSARAVLNLQGPDPVLANVNAADGHAEARTLHSMILVLRSKPALLHVEFASDRDYYHWPELIIQ